MATTLTVRNENRNSGTPATFPHPLEAAANADFRYYNRGGKVRLIFYMPASSTFQITVTSVPDRFGRSQDIVATLAAAGANPEIKVLGPFSPGLFNQKTGADKDYVLFTIGTLTGAVKVAALYG